MMKQYYVYILASRRNGNLYIGFTSDLLKRIYEHKRNLIVGFTKKYSVHALMYCDAHDNIEEAITRE
jgi:putative endonuclease